MHEEEMFQKQDSTWKDIINRQSSGGMEEEDWGVKEDSQYAVEPQFEDATIEEEDEEEVWQGSRQQRNWVKIP